MSFADIIKNTVMEKFNSADINTTTILVTLGMAAAVGLFIYFFYRFTARSSFYNRTFNQTLAALPMITAGIMLAMQSNLVISLGMVGALSIVRFRNAVKDPLDLMCLFWSISMGIIVGAGLFELAVLLSLCMAVLLFGLNLLPAMRAPFLLVVSCDKTVMDEDLMTVVKKYAVGAKVRSCNKTKMGTDWIFELQTKEKSQLASEVAVIAGVSSVNVLSHDGDVRF